MNRRQSDKIEFSMLVFFTIIFLIGLLLTGCGDKNATVLQGSLCVIQDRTITCEDGTYDLPEDIDPVEAPVTVVTEPAVEIDPEAICETDNRNKRKCIKVRGLYDY